MLVQQLLNRLVVGGTFAVFALAFTLLFGVNHILNMAHGSVFMWGAFVGLYVATALLGDGLAFEIEMYKRLVASEARHEGVRAFNERRTPQFQER